LATISAAAILLKRLDDGKNGYARISDAIDKAVSLTLADQDARTPDLGGKATTKDVTERVIHHLRCVL
jgi:isocitrate/isopropylmalate dehydrogenase